MKTMTFRPELSERTIEKLNRIKKERGYNKVWLCKTAIETYIDILEGRLQIIESETGHAEQQRTHH